MTLRRVAATGTSGGWNSISSANQYEVDNNNDHKFMSMPLRRIVCRRLVRLVEDERKIRIKVWSAKAVCEKGIKHLEWVAVGAINGLPVWSYGLDQTPEVH